MKNSYYLIFFQLNKSTDLMADEIRKIYDKNDKTKYYLTYDMKELKNTTDIKKIAQEIKNAVISTINETINRY